MKKMSKKLISLLITVLIFLSAIIPITSSAKTAAEKFTDVFSGQWYYKHVNYVYQNRLMNGSGDSKFAPANALTRAMLVRVMFNKEKNAGKLTGRYKHEVFEDVPVGTWYTEAVAWAKECGIVSGVGNNKFAPERDITREEMATMFYNYLKYCGIAKNANVPNKSKNLITGFSDYKSISNWAGDAVSYAVSKGMMSGKTGNRFDPKGSATRAEVATVLHNMSWMDSYRTNGAASTPKPTNTPKPASTPTPEVTPEPETTPEPASTPEPEATPGPVGKPETDTETLLLQKMPEINDAAPELSEYVYLSETARVILAAEGDIDGDENDDVAVVVEFAEENLGFNDRNIYVLCGDAEGNYEVAFKNENLILGRNEGGTFGNPLEGISMENGILTIKHYGGSSLKWAYTMDFSHNGEKLALSGMKVRYHSIFTVCGEETTFDFTNNTLERYSLSNDESKNLPLFSGKLSDKVYAFDDITFERIVKLNDIPHLPHLENYQFDRFDKPLDLKMSASEVLDMVMQENYPEFRKVNIPWTQENRENYSALLFYEVPDYYYEGPSGILGYAELVIIEDESGNLSATHRVKLDSSDENEYSSESYYIEDE